MDELQKKPSGSTPDLSSSSMAYMPKSKSAPDEDNDLKIDKKAEKKTVADLPDRLEAEGLVDEGIKVMVNGKPKLDPRPQDAKAMEKAPAPRVSHVAPLADGVHKKDVMNPDEEPAPAKKTRSGGKNKGLVFVVVLLLAVVIGLGYFAYASSSKVAKLNAELKQANADKQALQSLDKDTGEASPSTSVLVGDSTSKRAIPELGLMYALTSNTSKVTYAYSESQETGGTVRSIVSFSTTTLIAAERKALKAGATPVCLASNKALGSITSYKANDTVPASAGSGKFSDFKVDSKTSFKLGDTYYLYSAPQATCSSDKTVQAVETTDRVIVSELLNSLATQ